MQRLAKIFNKERIIYALIISVFGFLGTYYTARSQAASKTQEDLDKFKETTISQLGDVRGDVKALRGEMSARLDNLQGTTQTMSSRLNNFLDNRK